MPIPEQTQSLAGWIAAIGGSGPKMADPGGGAAGEPPPAAPEEAPAPPEPEPEVAPAEVAEAEPAKPPAKRARGRPKGSKDKKPRKKPGQLAAEKAEKAAQKAQAEAQPPPPTGPGTEGQAAETRGLGLGSLRDAVRQFAAERDWDQFHTPRNLLLALVGEVGELSELFQFRGEVQQGLPEFTDKEKERVGEEMSDVLSYLVRMADVSGIDLSKAVVAKLQQNVEVREGRRPSGRCARRPPAARARRPGRVAADAERRWRRPGLTRAAGEPRRNTRPRCARARATSTPRTSRARRGTSPTGRGSGAPPERAAGTGGGVASDARACTLVL